MSSVADPSVPERPEDDIEMTFFEHLGELRKRLMWSMVGFVPAMGVAWGFKEQILDILLAPLVEGWRAVGLGDPQVNFTNPIDPFVAYIQISAITGLLLASPWVFAQVWLFISPGLYKREKRMMIPFVLSSTLFFAGGVAFCYFVVMKMAFQTLLEFSGMLPSHNIEISPMITISDYLSITIRFLLAFGVTFEVPVVVTFLALAGVVTWRQLVSFARWWLLVSVIIAALLTPPDVFSQMMVFIPLNVLYWVSIVLAFFFGPKRPKPGELTEDGFER